MSEYIIRPPERVDSSLSLWPIIVGEIVRCRDCANYYEAEEYHPNGNYDRRCCKYFGTYDDEVSPDGFCAWAERKEGGDD